MKVCQTSIIFYKKSISNGPRPPAASPKEFCRIGFWSKQMCNSGLDGSLFGVLGASGISFLVSWGVCGPLGRHLGCPWVLLGGPWLHFWSPWDPFGLHLVTLGCPFGGLWGIFWYPFCVFSKNGKCMNSLRKTQVFIGFRTLEQLFFEGLRAWMEVKVWLRAAGCYLEAWWLDVGAGWLEGGSPG